MVLYELGITHMIRIRKQPEFDTSLAELSTGLGSSANAQAEIAHRAMQEATQRDLVQQTLTQLSSSGDNVTVVNFATKMVIPKAELHPQAESVTRSRASRVGSSAVVFSHRSAEVSEIIA